MVLLLLVLLLQPAQPPDTADEPPAEGTSSPSALVQAAEAARAQRETRQRIAALSREAEQLKRQSASILDELRRLDVERDLQRARAAEARQARAAIDAELDALAAEARRLEHTLEEEQPLIAARLRRLQRLGRLGYARLAWHAEGTQALGRASRLMTHIARDDGRRLARYRGMSDELARTRSTLDARREEARRLEEEARRRAMAAELAAQRKQELLATIQQETTQRERWLAALSEARTELDSTMAERFGTASSTPPPPVAAPVVPFTARRRRLPWPAEGAVVQRFGRQRDSRYGTSTLSNGVAIAAAPGASVRAIHPGTVVFAGPFTGFGQLVIVDHGQQTFSLYGYLSARFVERGMTVETGSVVGEAGDSPEGRPAVYLEVRVDGRPVDPLQWLQPRP